MRATCGGWVPACSRQISITRGCSAAFAVSDHRAEPPTVMRALLPRAWDHGNAEMMRSTGASSPVAMKLPQSMSSTYPPCSSGISVRFALEWPGSGKRERSRETCQGRGHPMHRVPSWRVHAPLPSLVSAHSSKRSPQTVQRNR